MEILGVIILAGLILGFTLWYMATHKAPEPYAGVPEVATTTPEALPPQVIEEHGQYYDIEVTYPAETALKASLGTEADQEALAAMEDFVEESVSEFKKQGNFENLTPEDVQIMGLSEDRKESILIAYEEIKGRNTVSYVYTVTSSAGTAGGGSTTGCGAAGGEGVGGSWSTTGSVSCSSRSGRRQINAAPMTASKASPTKPNLRMRPN